MKSPYEGRPPKSFWKHGVAEQPVGDIADLYCPRFDILPTTRIGTGGSCFAQHIAGHLRKQGYSVMDVEPAPAGVSVKTTKLFGYGIYSARYGNIYTARQLLQLAQEAFGTWEPTEPVWEREGRFYDALRPSVEPNGFQRPEEVRVHRVHHLRRVRRLFSEVEIFVFTFGLTEAWIHRESGTVYPTAPGTVAGSYDPELHAFYNFTYEETLSDFGLFRAMLKAVNPSVRFLLTVSPVPLTATASDLHVLPATVYSKSVLRAVAGRLYDQYDDVDYFPSYELIGTPFTGGVWFGKNLRDVRTAGVEMVMRHFFQTHGSHTAQQPPAIPETAEDLVCEEVLLEAFA